MMRATLKPEQRPGSAKTAWIGAPAWGLIVALALALPGPAGAVGPPDTIGLFRPNTPAGNNTFFLRNANTLAPPANTIAGFGDQGDEAVVGDWDGDGITTIGVFRPNAPAGSNTFFLRNSNTLGVGDVEVEAIGENGDIPIVGDWDGNGTTTVGLFRPNSPPGSNTVFLWNSHTNPPGPPDITIAGIGAVGDLPIVGNWDGNSSTTIGLFRPNSPAGTNTFFLWNTNTLTPPDLTVVGFGAVGDEPIAGDWDGNGTTTIGLFRPNSPAGTNTFFLLNTNTLTPPDLTIAGFGAGGDFPVAGHWGNNPPVVDPATVSLPENSANSTVVGTVTFTDPDNPGQTHTFSITGGNTGTAFTIHDTTGQITVNNSAALDLETTPSFNLTVRVTDNGTPVFFGEATITVNLTNVNDAPVLTAGATLAYTEGDPATVIDATVTVNDQDNTDLTQATVQITANYQNGSDLLACPAGCGGLTANFVAASGTLTLSTAASLATYQAALRTVTFQNTSDNPTATGATRTVTWIGNDGTASSTPVTSTINITAVNDAPVLTAGGTLNYTENQIATVIDGSVTVTDDSATLASATVQITTNCTNPQDVLSFTTQNGISGVYTAASCLMTLTGASSPANYQTALQSVKYNNTSENPSVLPRTVTWIANDGALPSSAVTSTINVTAVNDAPTGVTNKSHDVTGNVSITTAAGTLLAGATDPEGNVPLTAQGATTSAQGGNVTVNADGSYLYNPPAGYEGADSFTFQVCDSLAACSANATVNLTVSGMIWFINNNATACTTFASGCGRLSNPYSTLAAFNTENTGVGNGPAAGDNIFLYESATSYVGPVTLLNTQKLIGQDASQSLSALTGITPPTDSAALPAVNSGNGTFVTITSATGDVVLAQNNTLRGLTLGNATGTALSGTSFGTLTLADGSGGQPADLTINTTGQALNLTTGTIASVFAGITSTGGTNNISLTSVATTTTANLGGGALSGATGTSFNVSGGTGSFTYSGSITQTNNAALVSVANHSTGTITFSGTLNANTNSTGLQFSNADGTYNFNGTNTLNGGDAGIDITTGSAGTFTFSNNTSITNPTGMAYNEDTSTANVTYNGTITKTNNAANAVNINAKTGGTTAFAGAITASTTTANAIDLTNTGGTVNFTGGLNLTTTSGVGFNATGGGTISATQNNTTIVNTITSTTGTALNVNTIIGASGLHFRSIAANGGANGIVLNNTGTTAGTHGGLTVTGTGAAGTGGTIQNTTGRGASFITARDISLTNMNFTNTATSDLDADNSGLTTGDNLTTNAALHLETVFNATLNGLSISGSAEQGINGHNVTNFVLSNSSIANAGNGADEDGIHFYNMLGTSSITNTTITSSFDDNINIQNNTNVALPAGMTAVLNLTITGGSATNSQQGSGYLMGIRGTSNVTVTLDGVTSNNNFSGGIVIDTFDTATSTIEVKNATITNNNDGIALSSNNGSTKFDIHDNVSFAGNDFLRISILKAAFSTGGTLQGKIRNNPIVVADGQTTDAISIFNAGAGALTVSVTGNDIDYRGTQRAILVQGGQDGNGSMNVTITGNTIDMQLDGTGNAVAGILAQTAITGPGNTTSLCADIGGAGGLSNTFTHSLGGAIAAGDIRVRQRNDGTVRLPGYAGGATDTAAVIAYLNGRNTVVSASTATADSTGFAGGAACTQPIFP